MKTCCVEGCDSPSKCRGMCGLHYQRWLKHGVTMLIGRRPNGSGNIRNGYVRRSVSGVYKTEHICIVEKALGHPLPPGAEVHHLDKNRSNNTPTNLVVCPDKSYHRLLHRRADAYAACGNYDWRKCSICKQWDEPANLYHSKSNSTMHRGCHTAAYTDVKRRKA